MTPSFSMALTSPFRASSLTLCRMCWGSGSMRESSIIWNCGMLSLKAMADVREEAKKGRHVRRFCVLFQAAPSRMAVGQPPSQPVTGITQENAGGSAIVPASQGMTRHGTETETTADAALHYPGGLAAVVLGMAVGAARTLHGDDRPLAATAP